MDGELSQPTQPGMSSTQNVIDPRRIGRQHPDFTDKDIGDIICILFPYSSNARNEAARLARAGSPYVIGRDEASNVDIDYTYEDSPSHFGLLTGDPGSGPAFVLRLSAQVKDPLQGFTFGRNPNRCDICFNNDTLRRVSNIHFRIFINEHGVLMLQDQSTNGTVVDEVLLKARRQGGGSNMRTLNSGTKISILLQRDAHDLEFLVRVPRREGQHEATYKKNLRDYLERLALLADTADHTTAAQRPIGAGTPGDVDLFKRPSPRVKPISAESLPREWNGSHNYNRVVQIGKGAFAAVHLVTSKYDGRPYAAKELEKRHFIKNGVLDQKVENEMKIMQNIEHVYLLDQNSPTNKQPHIVRYIEHFDFDDRFFIIIMEYVPEGNLGNFISKKGALPEEMVKEMAVQLIDALGYLHKKNITHRDVKPDNILIGSLSPFSVKLTDFGLSKMVDNEQTFLRTFCGTLLYCAPEVYGEYTQYDENGIRNNRNQKRTRPTGQRYDHAVDIWSLGGVLFYCLTGQPPFPVKQGTSYIELLNWIMTQPLNLAPLHAANASSNCIHFLSLMLQNRPENRATVEALQNHPWLAGPEAVSADDLEQSASQLSIADHGPSQDNRHSGFQSDDEIHDDDFIGNDSQIYNLLPDPGDIPGSQSDHFRGHNAEPGSSSSHSPTIIRAPQHANQPRLFGEVNVSAIGSSGAIPENQLNLPLSDLGSSENYRVKSFSSDSDNSAISNGTFQTPRGGQRTGQQWSQARAQQQQNQPAHDSSVGGGDAHGNIHLPTPLSQPHNLEESHSVDELNNMTFDVASQSLGGAESILENLNMKSAATSNFRHQNTDFTSSKRKPTYDISDEFDHARPSDKSTIKRLKSDAHIAGLASDENNSDVVSTKTHAAHRPDGTESYASDSEASNEARAYAAIRPVYYSKTRRQIDLPVPKSVYWATNDPSSWHLQYPEMTQLQYNAFDIAATELGEEFRPGASVLWKLAMRHFAPRTTADGRSESEPRSRSHSASHVSDTASPPSDTNYISEQKENIVPHAIASASGTTVLQQTSPAEFSASPYTDHGTQQLPNAQIIVPVISKQGSVARFESVPASVVPNIKVPIAESITTWGRHPDNIQVFVPVTESRVPKHAFKVLLWRSDVNGGAGSEPWQELQPWEQLDAAGEAASRYHFYVSTKARHGIIVNGTPIPSVDHANARSASHNWMRLHNGDSIVVWHYKGDRKTAAAAKPQQTELVFRCRWGGSAKPRSALPASLASPNLVDESTSRRLDEACSRAERFVMQRPQQQRCLAASNNDMAERMERIEQERLRWAAFERKRTEVLAAWQHKQQGSRPLAQLAIGMPAGPEPMIDSGDSEDAHGLGSTTPTPSAVVSHTPGDRLSA